VLSVFNANLNTVIKVSNKSKHAYFFKNAAIAFSEYYGISFNSKNYSLQAGL